VATQAENADAGRRTGRRPGDSGSRERILQAARRQFGEGGFAATTIRSVASAADVDPALVVHFFGSKDELFASALDIPGDLPTVLLGALDGDPAGAPERLVNAYFEIWENPETAGPLTAMFRSATTNERAAAMLRRFVEYRVARSTGSLPQARETIALVFAQLLGVATARYVVRIEPLASMNLDDLKRRLIASTELQLLSSSR
jgi:AcrR family transcriptional regulator